MQAHHIWHGTRSRLHGDESCEYETYTFVGEPLGELEVEYDEVGNRGVTYRVYRTEEGNIIVHTYEWTRYPSEDHVAYVDTYASLDEAAENGFDQLLMNMHILDMHIYDVENWRAAQNSK